MNGIKYKQILTKAIQKFYKKLPKNNYVERRSIRACSFESNKKRNGKRAKDNEDKNQEKKDEKQKMVKKRKKFKIKNCF